MTRLPIESRLAVDRPDLPEYPLNQACPITGEVTGLENHHLWRRREYPSYWVELPTGEIVGNRIMLSSQAHYRVTVNTARIAYEDGVFWWVEDDDWTELRWQPPTMPGRKFREGLAWASDVLADPGKAAVVASGMSAEDVAEIDAALNTVEPGHDCPTCRRRVPLPKKATSPAETKPMTFGRAPVDAADELKQRVDDLARSSGLSKQAYPQVRAIMLALILAESVNPETLAEVASGMSWGRKRG